MDLVRALKCVPPRELEEAALGELSPSKKPYAVPLVSPKVACLARILLRYKVRVA